MTTPIPRCPIYSQAYYSVEEIKKGKPFKDIEVHYCGGKTPLLNKDQCSLIAGKVHDLCVHLNKMSGMGSKYPAIHNEVMEGDKALRKTIDGMINDSEATTKRMEAEEKKINDFFSDFNDTDIDFYDTDLGFDDTDIDFYDTDLGFDDTDIDFID